MATPDTSRGTASMQPSVMRDSASSIGRMAPMIVLFNRNLESIVASFAPGKHAALPKAQSCQDRAIRALPLTVSARCGTTGQGREEH